MDVRITFFCTILTVLIKNIIICENWCEISIKTKRVVNSCPSNETEMEKSSEKLNCDKYRKNNTCSEDPDNIYYHCVLNEFGNKTLEVCAPKLRILGHCTEFNEEAGIIQANYYLDCTKFRNKPCGVFYESNQAFLYKECYNFTNNAKIFEAGKKLSTSSLHPKIPQQPTQVFLDEGVSESDIVSLAEMIICNVSIMVIIILVMFILFYKLYNREEQVDKKNHWANFYQTGYKACLREGHFSLFK